MSRQHTFTFPQLSIHDDDGDGIWIASDDRTFTYGAGETPELAIIDYLDTLAFLWKDLVDSSASLGIPLQRDLETLRGLIR